MNWKTTLTAIVTLVAVITGKFGLHLSPEDQIAIVTVGTFILGVVTHDGSIGDWRSTVAGLVGAAAVLAGRAGLHLTPEIQVTIVTFTVFLIGLVAKDAKKVSTSAPAALPGK